MSIYNEIKILNLIDGDMLNERDGIIVNGSLLIGIRVSAPNECQIRINGIYADYQEGVYTSNIMLKDYSNRIEVVEEKSGYSIVITVYYLKNYTGKYRLSLDDNIWFLKDISINENKYKSIFDNAYLGFMKQVHDQYGTKIHINIYYQTDGFNLSQMTVKFKNEWRQNSGWLRLSFHALGNLPDNPYINAEYAEVKKHCEMVMEQIERFAGQEMIDPVTTLHWGAATIEASRALRDMGYLGQVGYFNVDNDQPPVSYYLDVEKRRNMSKRSIWKDTKENIIFSKSALVINCFNIEDITPFLDEILLDPHRSGYMDLLIHEQFFYESYVAYQPKYREKILKTVSWAQDNGYKSAFLSDCIFK